MPAESPTGARVLVAMSGGVDSSVAALLLRDAGHEVVGCFMRLGSPGDAPIEDGGSCGTGPAGRRRGCCSVNDAADARLVAADLGVPFYVCNFDRHFGRVMSYFVDEHAAGRTPNPCVRCNDWLKFGSLADHAARLGADLIASGHYARVDQPSGGPVLRRGVDRAKDQSYVLFGVDRDELARMRLPVGGLRKAEVRDIARRRGLPVFDKPDSQDICFVPDGDHAAFVGRRLAESGRPARPGQFVDEQGRVVGEHDGHHHFTVGQRRGVGVALGRPVYVVSKEADTGRVVLGDRGATLAAGCVAAEPNWLRPGSVGAGWRPCLAQHRYNARAVAGRVRSAEVPGSSPCYSGRTGGFEVEFDRPEAAVTPGQAIVIYDPADPDVVLGGGWIAAATPSRAGPPAAVGGGAGAV